MGIRVSRFLLVLFSVFIVGISLGCMEKEEEDLIIKITSMNLEGARTNVIADELKKYDFVIDKVEYAKLTITYHNKENKDLLSMSVTNCSMGEFIDDSTYTCNASIGRKGEKEFTVTKIVYLEDGEKEMILLIKNNSISVYALPEEVYVESSFGFETGVIKFTFKLIDNDNALKKFILTVREKGTNKLVEEITFLHCITHDGTYNVRNLDSTKEYNVEFYFSYLSGVHLDIYERWHTTTIRPY